MKSIVPALLFGPLIYSSVVICEFSKPPHAGDGERAVILASDRGSTSPYRIKHAAVDIHPEHELSMVAVYDSSHAILAKGETGSFYNYSVGILYSTAASAYNRALIYAHGSSTVDLYDNSVAILFGDSVARIHDRNARAIGFGNGDQRVIFTNEIHEWHCPYLNITHMDIVGILIVFLVIYLNYVTAAGN